MALNRVVGSGMERGPVLGMGSVIPGGQGGRWALGAMLGRSSAMERLFLQMRYLAGHLRLGLLEGERGTGKHLAAETLHGLAPHRNAPFVQASAREFFLEGRFAAKLGEARGGTLYLSGVDELQTEAQGRLLHLLGWVAGSRARTALQGPGRAGEGAEAQPRAILVCSERPLRSLVLHGKFRADLQQQLMAVHLQLPPLRERREDIPLLLERFLEGAARERGLHGRGTAPDLLPALLAYHWPGNVRELKTAVARGLERAEGGFLRRADLVLAGLDQTAPAAQVWVARPGAGPRLAAAAPPRAHGRPGPELHRSPLRPAPGQPASLPRTARPVFEQGSEADATFDANLDRAIMRHVRRVLANVNGNKLRAARLLGISRSTLYRLLDADAGQPGEARGREASDARQDLRGQVAEGALG